MRVLFSSADFKFFGNVGEKDPLKPISNPFLRPSTMYMTRGWSGWELSRRSNKSIFTLQDFLGGMGQKGFFGSGLGNE